MLIYCYVSEKGIKARAFNLKSFNRWSEGLSLTDMEKDDLEYLIGTYFLWYLTNLCVSLYGP